MESILGTVNERELQYSRQRQRNRVFTALVSFFARESENRGLSRKDVASALQRDPAQITRWLSQPSNLTLDTISDLLLSLGAEMDVRIVKFDDRAKANFMHPLASRIRQISSDATNAPVLSGLERNSARATIANKKTSTTVPQFAILEDV